ncbi:efflux RND transporter permease subunit [Jeotgalibacillus soli]|uniref:Swarming motility protein SwrC n=1 Tax=Jeotgalibacillus soli TaxID=889306 RepID=A0A0C2VL12_9BACL|nr:efflux RND transporter permease subunit [Jeotgalibacillus soli]KIL49572.1 swarming motility protein SwrC [Jeotgalibacillus soli]
MNRIISFSLNNKLAIWLLTIIVTVAGMYSGLNMKLETLPSISTPVITVTTVYPGAAPEEVVEDVTSPIELVLQNQSGVQNISSSSFANVSSVQIEYSYSTDMDQALEDAKIAVDGVSLPDNAQSPDLSRLSFDAFPVFSLSLSAEGSSLTELTELVEGEIVPSLEGIEGVSNVGISGQQLEQIVLTFDEDRLAETGLTQQTVEQIIQGASVEFPLGLFTFTDEQKAVVINGNISNIEQLENLQIPIMPTGAGDPAGASDQPASTPAQNGLPTITLGEIASLELVGEAESISRTNGVESIGVQITKAPEANTVDVVNSSKEMLDELAASENFEWTPVFDQGAPIEQSVKTMLEKAIIGAGFAVLIILLFLRNIKSTIISVISIPLSLLMAVLLLNQLGLTLNIMTLGAMTVAIGRVVDDSIVVIENIFRRMAKTNETLTGKELIKSATKEMFVPIMSSTIVTIAVFLPLGLVEGPVGELFLPFALTVVFALLASLLVSITIVPMMAHWLFKKGIGEKHHDKPSKLANWYQSVLKWTLNHKLVTFGGSVLLLVGSFALVPLIGVSFIPAEEEKMAIVTYNPSPGETESQVEEVVSDAETYFLNQEDVEMVQFSLGGENPMNPGAQNQALFYVGYDDETENFQQVKEQIIVDLQAQSEQGEWVSQDFSSTGASNAISVNVYGETLDEITPMIEEIEAIFQDNEDLTNVGTSIEESYNQYTFVANQERLGELGLSAAQIGMALSQNGQSDPITTIEQDGKKLDVVIQVETSEYATIDDMTSETIITPLGIPVEINELISVEEGESSNTIIKRNGSTYASVNGQVTSDDIGAVQQTLQSAIDDIENPNNLEISFGGVTEQINDSFTQLGLAMLVAIAVVYLVLVITFGGGLAPLAILFSLPFTIVGGLVALWIGGETLSVSALIGALMLIGIVVTNAIVLIDRVIQKEKEGLSVRNALLEAGATRLRPILMTALATIGALVPLAIDSGGGALISRGLGLTVIGGLTSSTLLTLVIVPIVYEFFMNIKARFTKKEQKNS